MANAKVTGVQASKIVAGKSKGRVWKHYFDNYKMARKFAKEHDAEVVKVNKTSTMVYLVTYLGE